MCNSRYLSAYFISEFMRERARLQKQQINVFSIYQILADNYLICVRHKVIILLN